MYYPSSENKGADQLRGYREADLRLCFRICRLLVFPRGGSYQRRKAFYRRKYFITLGCFCNVLRSWALSDTDVSKYILAITLKTTNDRLTKSVSPGF